MRPITFAHRGARTELPENTVPAFERALALGAGGLESDAWLSADGEVVLVHDPVVRNGLRRLRVSRSAAARLAEAGVPRLRDVYGSLGAAYELSLDIKDPRAAEPVIELAREVRAASRLWLCSPDVDLLGRLRDVAPDVRLVHSVRRRAVTGPIERHAFDLARIGIDAMNMHHTDWTRGLVALFHRFEVRAFAWDAQEVRHLEALLRMDVDALYCDRPERMVAVVEAYRGADGA
ncbi:MAG: glycerophosphodiester phosphodiesterase family protein [Acidimicrobiia bacterium]|nr:glycerophosphodiester phosphodiesterase family protein [Acidimicrobiia bacterium]